MAATRISGGERQPSQLSNPASRRSLLFTLTLDSSRRFGVLRAAAASSVNHSGFSMRSNSAFAASQNSRLSSSDLPPWFHR